MSAPSGNEALLRAALHKAADSLEPGHDGLMRIRNRLHRRRPAPVAVVLAVWTELFRRAPAWLQDAFYWLAYGAGLVRDRFGPVHKPGRHRSRADGWLRPLAAMGVVMFIVAAGTYMAIDASTGIFPSAVQSGPDHGTNSGANKKSGPGHGRPNANGSPQVSGPNSHSPTPARSCGPSPSTTTASHSPASSKSPCPRNATMSGTPSVTPSVTPSSTSQSPSPSATSNNPSTDPSATPSAAAS